MNIYMLKGKTERKICLFFWDNRKICPSKVKGPQELGIVHVRTWHIWPDLVKRAHDAGLCGLHSFQIAAYIFCRDHGTRTSSDLLSWHKCISTSPQSWCLVFHQTIHLIIFGNRLPQIPRSKVMFRNLFNEFAVIHYNNNILLCGYPL
jgi:hypothetical protein